MAVEKTLFLDDALKAIQTQQLTTLTLQAVQKKVQASFKATAQLSWISDTGTLACITVLPDGRVISSSSCTLEVWDVKTGTCVQTLSGHTDSVYCVAMLPDGRVVSGSYDNMLKVWDMKTGSCVQALSGHTSAVYCVATLSNNRVVSGSRDEMLKVWDMKTGQCVQTLSGHWDRISCVAALPDGRIVSGSGDKTLKVWDVKTGKCTQTLSGHTRLVKCVAALPDGRVVSGSEDNTLKVWDMKTGTCVQILSGHRGNVRCVAALPGGRMVSGSWDSTLKVWEPDEKILALTPQDQATLLTAVQNNTSLTTLNLFRVALVDIPQGVNWLKAIVEKHPLLERLDLSETGLTDAMFHKFFPILRARKCIGDLNVEGNPLLSQVAKDQVKTYQESLIIPIAKSLAASLKLPVIPNTPKTLIPTSFPEMTLFLDNAIKAIQNQQLTTLTLQAIQKKTQDPEACFKASAQQSLHGHTSSVLSSALLPDGRVVSGSEDNTLKMWDVKTGICVQTLNGHTDCVCCVAVLPDGRVVSGSWDKTLKVWDMKMGTCVQTLSGHTSGVNCVAVLPDGRVVSGSSDKTLKVWDVKTGTYAQTLSGHTSGVNCVAVLPNGRVISGSSDETLKVWDITRGTCVQTLSGHTGTVDCVTVLPDGRVISGLRNQILRVWDLKRGIRIQTLGGHTETVNCVVLLPNRGVISGSLDNTLKVWEFDEKILALTPQDQATLLATLQTNTSLTYLNLSGVALADIPEGVNWLTAIVEKHPFLESLNLSETGLTDAMFHKFFPILCVRKCIEELNIEGNPLLSPAAKDQVKAYHASLKASLFPSPPTHVTPDKIPALPKPVVPILKSVHQPQSIIPLAVPAPLLKPESKPYVEKSWHFDPLTERSTTLLEDKDYALLSATPKDIQKVIGFYQHHPMAHYDIKKVEVIYNRNFNQAFQLHLSKLQKRDNNLAFVPKWQSMSNASVRQDTVDLFTQLTLPYTDPDYPAVKLLPAWHGTKPQVLDSIFSAGYANLATTDAGFFGKGYYSAYEAEYSYRVYSQGALILNWVASFSPLPVVGQDMNILGLEGKSNYGNYDAHFVPVKPLSSNNPNEKFYYPCQSLSERQYTEMVVFDSAALLPRYLVELQPTLVKPMPSVSTGSYKGVFLPPAQQKKEENPPTAQHGNSNVLNN